MANETPQKLRGGFYTDLDLALFLTRWMSQTGARRVLEPSCGDGAFLRAMREQAFPSLRSVSAFEIDPEEAAKARSCRGEWELEVRVGNFLRWFLFEGREAEPFDGVVGNPPFVRYQYLTAEQQWCAEKIVRQYGLPFTKHANLWVPFVVASLALLRPGGRLAMVVPAELLHIPHAQALRQFLVAQCARVVVLDPEELWFGGTLQGTVLLLAEKKRSGEDFAGVVVHPIRNRSELTGEPDVLRREASFARGKAVERKWMSLLLQPRERALLEQVETHPQVRRFRDLANVDVGIVTGANQFFLVPDAVVRQFELERWAHPMFGRSEHVPGLIYTAADHAANRSSGLPANFLLFNEGRLEDLPPNVVRYLEIGCAQKLPERYKCRVRTPWYKVPSVYASPVAMLKRAHHYPRLVLNQIGAYTTDTAYRIRPLRAAPEDLVYVFVNSLTCLSAELEGRHYGGGVLELVPSEIERLLIPVVQASADELAAADVQYRQSPDAVDFLRAHDSLVLEAIGISREDRETLFSAWWRLCRRRQRIR